MGPICAPATVKIDLLRRGNTAWLSMATGGGYNVGRFGLYLGNVE